MAITLFSCNSSKTNNNLNSKNNLLYHYNYNLDSIAKLTPISKSDFIKIELGEVEINEEGIDMINEIVELHETADIKSDYSIDDITKKASNFEINHDEIYLSELKENKDFQNYLYSLASKSLLNSAKSIVDDEFGILRQFHHLWNVLLVKCHIKDKIEITEEWTQIINDKLSLVKLNQKLNSNINNYQKLIYYKHHVLNPLNTTKIENLHKAEISLKEYSLVIVPYIQQKLSNEGYDLVIDLFFTFLIYFITSLIYKPLINNAIIEANNWSDIREDLLKTGEHFVQSKRKSKENSLLMNFAMGILRSANKGWTEYKIREAKAKFESKQRFWNTTIGAIVTIATLFYFVPKDLIIEEKIQEDLTQIFVKNITVKNIDIQNSLDKCTTHFFNK